MATPTVVEALIQQSENAVATVTTAAGTLATDLLVTWHFADFYAASLMVAPTGTSGSGWTLQATGDAGTNDVHVKVWTKLAAAGSQTIICNQVSDACVWNITYVVRGQGASPIDGAAGNQGTTNVLAHAAPAVSPVQADDLLLCGAMANTAVNYTPPPGMSEDFDSDCGGNSTATTARQNLTSSGSTGSKIFTSSGSSHFASASIAIAGVASAPVGRPQIIIPTFAVQRGASW